MRARPCPGNCSSSQPSTCSAAIARRQRGSVQGAPPSSVSPRSPRRSVSSGMTSSGGMLPRLTDGPNCLMNQACAAFDGASKMTFSIPTALRDLADQLGAHAARRVEDAGRAALARLGDDLPRAGVELLAQPLRPLVGGVLDRRVLRADLGEDGEVAREVRDQLELALARDVDRAVGDLDVRRCRARGATACTRRACPAT